ncbi:MAG: ABC transporter permease [Acidobacteria bacterium]|nr:ABC transporter permease [Acidobacteriota bacterium]
MLVAALAAQSVWLRRGRRRTISGRGWWPLARLGFRGAAHRPARSVLCIALVASAAFIIVAVEAFRQEGGGVSADRKSGGGGYALMAETLLPLTHDPNAAEGREALGLGAGEGPDGLAGVFVARFRVRPGDDASCLNLYQPQNPKLLGAGADFIRQNRFSFQDSHAAGDAERENPWLLLERDAGDGAIPVAADAKSLAYVLHKKVGDEIVVKGAGGEPVRLRIVAALADSLFQSELLMSERNFLRAFPEQQGYRYFLLDAPPEAAASVAGLLEDKLSDFGFDAISTAERLASFHRVENTYLSTFQTLGGLGMLLGTLGLAAVLLRNVLERRRELALLRAVGYGPRQFVVMIVAENALLLLCGLATGAACALLAVAPALLARGVGGAPRLTLALLLLAVLAAGFAASLAAAAAALRTPLLPALRSE